MTYPKTSTPRAGIVRRGLAAGAVALLLPLGACNVDKLLKVSDPDVATPGSVADSTALPAVYAGVLYDFSLAYDGSGNDNSGGSNDSQILLSGLLGDEFQSNDTFDTRNEIDARDIRVQPSGGSTNGQLEDAERNLQRARVSAEHAAAQFASLGHGDDPRRSEVLSIAGFTYILFGENYCAGVTFSTFPLGGGAPIYGTPTTRDQVFNLALARFDTALAVANAAGDADLANLARVGRGRALVNLGRFTDAAAAVNGVPTGFEYLVQHSANTSGEENGVWSYTVDDRRYGVSDNEGVNGLPYRTEGHLISTNNSGVDTTSTGDIRVLYAAGGRPFDTSTGAIFWAQQKYPDRTSPEQLATGVEARLIEAEAALNGGPGSFIGLINAERAYYGLPAVADPGTSTGRRQLLFKERAYALWLTAHRLGDLRRLMRQYNQPENQVFPVGTDIHGADYGTDKNLPIYIDEANNPNFAGCTDRNA